MKYSDVTRYIDGAVELELATRQRRVSLVGGDEVSRVGEIAFAGSDTEQDLIDAEISRAVCSHFAPERQRGDTDELKNDLAAIVGVEEAEELRGYAEARVRKLAALTGKTEPRAATLTGESMRFNGVWEDGAKYGRGAVVQHSSTIWISQANTNADRPGTSGSWRMLVKTADLSNRKAEKSGAGGAAA